MSLFLKREGWEGSAHWMGMQAGEEREHALSMADYLIKRGGPWPTISSSAAER